MRNRIKISISYLITILLIAIFYYWLDSQKYELSSSINLSIQMIIVLVLLTIISTILISLNNQLAISTFGTKLPYKNWLYLGFASAAINHILPFRSGAIFRAAYLRKVYKFPISHFSSGFLSINLLAIFGNAALGLITINFSGLQTADFGLILAIFFISLTTSCLFIFFVPTRTLDTLPKNNLLNFIKKAHTGFIFLRKQQSFMMLSTLLSLINTGMYSLRLYISFTAIGYDVDIYTCILSGVFSTFLLFLTFTPAGIGIREAGIVLIGGVADIPPEICLIAAALDRAVSMSVILAIGSFSLFALWRQTRSLQNFSKP